MLLSHSNKLLVKSRKLIGRFNLARMILLAAPLLVS
jgi:hypothetical protein